MPSCPPGSFSTADLFDTFKPDATANVRVCQPGLRSYGGRARYCGRIATVRNAGDVAMRLRDILEEPGSGRVLVADGRGCSEWALLGDRMAALAIARGWAGIVLNGYVRDLAALRGLDIGVHALGSIPSRPDWPSPPQYVRGTPVTILNCAFMEGAWAYVDEDGILVADRALVSTAAR